MIFAQVMNGRRVEVPIKVGAFTFPGSGIAPMDKVCMPFQTLDQLPMTIHSQKGGLCCSPNNCRVVLNVDHQHHHHGPVAHMWVVTVAGEEGEEKEHGIRASVSLQWIVHQPVPGLAERLKACKNVREALDVLQERFGRNDAAVLAACMMMGAVEDDDGKEERSRYGVQPETGPLKNQRRDDRGRGGRGGGRRGGGRNFVHDDRGMRGGGRGGGGGTTFEYYRGRGRGGPGYGGRQAPT